MAARWTGVTSMPKVLRANCNAPSRVGDGMQDREHPDITLDHLAGGWQIFQLRRGHRFSVDDLLTAWAAVHAQPQAHRVLDLGAGIGSIGLLVLWKLEAAGYLTMVEVQAVSHALAYRTVAHNGLTARVALHLMDLRDWPGGNFDLITASPPYRPLARGVRPQHAQKAVARFEIHGDIFALLPRRDTLPRGHRHLLLFPCRRRFPPGAGHCHIGPDACPSSTCLLSSDAAARHRALHLCLARCACGPCAAGHPRSARLLDSRVSVHS